MDVKSGAKVGTLAIGTNNYELPCTKVRRPDVVDISKLYDKAGVFTYDPGYTSTAGCESKITFVDGGEGVLLYRGYPIEQLAEHSDFLETCYLLLYGELPTAAQKADFDRTVTRHTMIHEQMARSSPRGSACRTRMRRSDELKALAHRILGRARCS